MDKNQKTANPNTLLICIISLLLLHVLPDIFKYPVVIVTLFFAFKEITYYLPPTLEERKKLTLHLTSTFLFVTLLVYVILLWILLFLDVNPHCSIHIGEAIYSARLLFALITLLPNLALLLCGIGLSKSFKAKKRNSIIAFVLFLLSLCTLICYFNLSIYYAIDIIWYGNSIALAIFFAELIIHLITIWRNRKNWSKLKSLYFD